MNKRRRYKAKRRRAIAKWLIGLRNVSDAQARTRALDWLRANAPEIQAVLY